MGVMIVYFLETNKGVPNVIYLTEHKKWLSSILRNFDSIIISFPGVKKIMIQTVDSKKNQSQVSIQKNIYSWKNNPLVSKMKHYSLINFNEKINIKLFISSNIKKPRDVGRCVARIYVGWCVCLYAMS